MDLAALTEGLQGVPLIYLAGAGAMVIVASMLVLRVFANTLRGKAPPIDEGIPFVGGLIKFSKVRGPRGPLPGGAGGAGRRGLSQRGDFKWGAVGCCPSQGPIELITEQYQRHGEVFTVPVLHKRITFLLGPAASPHFFNATDDKMSQTEVYDFNVPTFGKGVVYDVDQRVRSEQFRFVAEALRTAKLRTYVPAFRQEAEEYFAKWGDTGVVDLMEVFSELIILTASRTLLGEGAAGVGWWWRRSWGEGVGRDGGGSTVEWEWGAGQWRRKLARNRGSSREMSAGG